MVLVTEGEGSAACRAAKAEGKRAAVRTMRDLVKCIVEGIVR